MSLKYLPEHAQAALLALDLACKSLTLIHILFTLGQHGIY